MDNRQRRLARAILAGASGVIVAAQFVIAAPPAAHDNIVSLSDDEMWATLKRVPDAQEQAEPWVRPMFFQPIALDRQVLAAALSDVPMEFTQEGVARPTRIDLPMPDGTFATFEIVESPVMAPELAAQFPEIKTYSGQGITDPAATVRLDWTPQGFHAQVLSPEGSYYIDPYSKGDTTFYSSYYRRDLRMEGADGWTCSLFPDAIGDQPRIQRRQDEQLPTSTNASGTFLQTYRTAVAATGEYTAFHGGTAALGQAAIVTAINRVTGVYERDCAIRLQLVANNINVVYTNSGTDPYTNNNGVTMLSQNQTNLNAVIGSANYDLGHVFSTGGGGIAGLGVVCGSSKAQGVTGLPSPTGDPFYIDYVAHEMGHQFGANHSFNSTASSCNGNRASSAAYEPGSGSTIMSYAGICGTSNLQSNSNDYFVHKSYDEIVAWTNGSGGCPTNVANGNTVPTIDAGLNYTIPVTTPFELTPASYGDANGDTLTFCWEQRDLGAAQNASGGVIADNGTSPFIRTWSPTTNPTRTIPRTLNLLNNTFVIGEALPGTNRVINFRCTVRDNRSGGGGVNFDSMQVTSTTSAGPFVVTSPNTNVVWAGTQTVTWSVANTNLAPVNCANVDILLSTDGGNTFPTVLLAGTPNDGSQAVTLPSLSTSSARIKVKGAGNIFFDISNTNFQITPAPTPGPFSLTSPANTAINVPTGPTFQWTASNNATSYELTVDDEGTFTPPFVYQNTTAALSDSLSSGTLAEGALYFWRVEAINGLGSAFGAPNPANFTTVPPPPFCIGDADGDHDVDFDDITSAIANWLAVYTPGSAGPGDANNNGVVNFEDINIILSNWGSTCP